MNTYSVIKSLIADLEYKRDRMTMYDEYLSKPAQVGLLDFVIKSLDILSDVSDAVENESYMQGYDKGLADAKKTLQ